MPAARIATNTLIVIVAVLTAWMVFAILHDLPLKTQIGLAGFVLFASAFCTLMAIVAAGPAPPKLDGEG